MWAYARSNWLLLDFRADEYDEFSPTAIAVIDAMFDRVNKVLDGQSQPFLGGATLGADDIILAAHASWLFFPDELGAGTFARFPSWEMLPKRYRMSEHAVHVCHP